MDTSFRGVVDGPKGQWNVCQARGDGDERCWLSQAQEMRHHDAGDNEGGNHVGVDLRDNTLGARTGRVLEVAELHDAAHNEDAVEVGVGLDDVGQVGFEVGEV